MDKTTFISALTESRTQWDALLAQIDEQWMLEPGAEGNWSVKDIIAHIMWYEQEMVPLMQARSLIGSELWNLSQDERNEAIYQQYRDHPLHELISQEQQTYAQLLAEAKTLSDEDLNDPHRFKDMPDDWTPWRIMAGNSFTHYPDHISSIRAWLAQRQESGKA